MNDESAFWTEMELEALEPARLPGDLLGQLRDAAGKPRRDLMRVLMAISAGVGMAGVILLGAMSWQLSQASLISPAEMAWHQQTAAEFRSLLKGW